MLIQNETDRFVSILADKETTQHILSQSANILYVLRKSRESNLQGGLANGLNNSHTTSFLCHVLRFCWPLVSSKKLAQTTTAHRRPGRHHSITGRDLTDKIFLYLQDAPGGKEMKFQFVQNPLPLLFLPSWTPTDLGLAAPG